MERYGAYKNSGVEWIGEIPAGWNLHRAKTAFTARRTKGNKELVQLAATQDRGMIPQSELDSVVQVSEDADLTQFRTVRKDDFVISLRSFQGGFELSRYEGVCSPAYQVFYGNGAICASYFKYLFKSDAFISKMNSLTVGIREGKNIQFQDFANSLLAFPPVAEQQAIADYLDAKTAEIDTLVADCEREVELLREYRKAVISEAVTKGLDPDAPMKDSGIEWIGDIPEEWKTNKLRYCGTTQNGISKGGEYFGTGYPFVSYGNVYRNELDKPELFGLIESTEDDRERYGIKRGDVLFTRTSETIEEVGIAAGALYGIADCCFAGFLIRFRPSDGWGVLPEYAAYYFRSDLHRPYLTKEMVLVTRASMSQQLLGGITVLIPPINEQEDIVWYLDAKTAEIDALVDAKQQMADKLREYRKSLISEAVTGKFRVPSVSL